MGSISKPKLNTCWFCETPKSAAALSHGRAVCAKCDSFMAQGVICIGVNAPLERDVIIDKSYRNGNWCVLSRDEFVKRFGYFPAEHFDYVPPEKWMRASLPRFGKHGASHDLTASYAPAENLDALDDNDPNSDNDNNLDAGEERA